MIILEVQDEKSPSSMIVSTMSKDRKIEMCEDIAKIILKKGWKPGDTFGPISMDTPHGYFYKAFEFFKWSENMEIFKIVLKSVIAKSEKEKLSKNLPKTILNDSSYSYKIEDQKAFLNFFEKNFPSPEESAIKYRGIIHGKNFGL